MENQRSLSSFPVWLACAAALVEVVVLHLRLRANPLLPLSRDFVWMAPLALLAVTLAAAGPLVLLARWWRPASSLALALFVSTSLVALDLLMLVPRVSHYALALLAAGVGVQVTRLAVRKPARVVRLMRLSTPWLAAGYLLVGGWVWFSAPPRSVPSATASGRTGTTPNLLLISLDTVRAASLGLYGYERPTTPALDRLAKDGVVFDNAFATAPWTLPSHASLFTGRWPEELGTDFAVPLSGKHLTLAEVLASRGFDTAGIAANLKFCGAATGLARGFAEYQDYLRSVGEVASSSTLLRAVANNFTLRKAIANDEHLNRISAESINARALTWLAQERDGPFFLFLNYFDAHEPYLPPPPFDRRFGPGRASGRYSPLHHWLWNPGVVDWKMGAADHQEEVDAYDGALAYLDHHLGVFFDELQRRGHLDNTVVVITADHGEEFGEHGVYEHGYSLYRPSLQVPLIVIAPGRVPNGRRVHQPVSLRDVPATVLHLMGGFSGPSPLPGLSLARTWEATAVPDAAVSPVLSEVSPSARQRAWFPSSKGTMKSVIVEGWRYILNGDGREELYDLASDPWERRDLSAAPEAAPGLAAARAAVARGFGRQSSRAGR